MTKVLGISGSPRRHGNTETLLDRALDGASGAGADVEKIVLNEMDLRPCRACGGCSKTADCVIEDGMRLVLSKVRESDGLVIASPVYYGSITAQLKTMIDRFQPHWVRRYALKSSVSKNTRKDGLFLCASALSKPAFFRNAESIIKIFFLTLGVNYSGGIYCPGVDGAGEIRRKASFMKRAFDSGAKIVKV